MTWMLRFLGWATVLAVPCWLVTKPYQQWLGVAAALPFAPFGLRVETTDINVAAPFDIGIFIALCVASRRAAPRRRKRALWMGIPIMVVVELATIVAAMTIVLASRSREAFEASMRMMSYLIETIPWVSAGLLWLLLLGPFEISPPVRRILLGLADARAKPGEGQGPPGA